MFERAAKPKIIYSNEKTIDGQFEAVRDIFAETPQSSNIVLKLSCRATFDS